MLDAFTFVLESALLGVGLAMDAFSVSLANGLSAPDMPRGLVGSRRMRAYPAFGDILPNALLAA